MGSRIEMPRTILRGSVDSKAPDRSFAHANSTQSCRPREALLSSGTLCRKRGITIFWLFPGRGNGLFRMKRSKLDWALTGVAVYAVACALAWPRARDAGAVLAAQDDPAALSDARINSALRNDDAAVIRNNMARNIEAALAASDPDWPDDAHVRSVTNMRSPLKSSARPMPSRNPPTKIVGISPIAGFKGARLTVFPRGGSPRSVQ